MAPKVDKKVVRKLPAGLSAAFITCWLPSSDLRLAALKKEYGDLDGFTVDPDGDVWGEAVSDAAYPKAHAHFTLFKEGKNKKGKGDPETSLNVQIMPTRFTAKGVQFTVSAFLGMISGFLRDPNREYPVYYGAFFEFDGKEWEPTFPLPFSMPLPLGPEAGSPTIAGVEFAFERGSHQALSRVSISTFDRAQRVVARIMMSRSAVISNDLIQESLDSVATRLPTFVRRVPGSTDAS